MKISIPKVLGRTLRQAQPTLLAVGFNIGKITTRAHISDQVLEMRHKGLKIRAGDRVQRTSIIDIVVGDGSLNRIKAKQKINTQDKDNEDGAN